MEELLGLGEFIVALTYGGIAIYVRQTLLKEYRHYTAKGYLKQQNLKKIISSKTDVSLYFTQIQEKQNNLLKK